MLRAHVSSRSDLALISLRSRPRVAQDAQRAKMKLLLHTLDSMNPNARKNLLNAMGDIRPSHLLDRGLRAACGLDADTGSVVHERALGIRVRAFELSNT